MMKMIEREDEEFGEEKEMQREDGGVNKVRSREDHAFRSTVNQCPR
jgi:hypothetical protein